MSNSFDMLVEASAKLGRQHGTQYGAIVVNSSILNIKMAKFILNGYVTGDDKVMDLCPSPLSGEWAGEPTQFTVIDEIANLAEAYHLIEISSLDEALNETENILDIYENAFNLGFWDTVLLAASTIVEAEVS